MTPQDLINLPGAGNAEKALRKAGKWNVTINDTERIEWLDGMIVSVKTVEENTTLLDAIGHYWGGGIRGLIDNAATQNAMEAQCN
jgi:hypothetical protein